MLSWITFGASSINLVLTVLACSALWVDDKLLITLLDRKRSRWVWLHSHVAAVILL